MQPVDVAHKVNENSWPVQSDIVSRWATGCAAKHRRGEPASYRLGFLLGIIPQRYGSIAGSHRTSMITSWTLNGIGGGFNGRLGIHLQLRADNGLSLKISASGA